MLRIVLAVMMVTAIVGVVGLMVLPPVVAQASPSATRSFDKTTVEPDGEVVVTITVADYGATGGVAETLPTGFTYESSSLSAVRVTGQKVEFGLIGIPSFTYTVTAPRTTGTFTFNGTLQDHDRNPYPVGGPSTVTVAAPSGPTPSATRSFDKTTVEPDGEVVVTITVADYGDTGGVAETLPAGFTYESSSLSAVRVTGQKVEFGLIGIPSFTYTVTAPRTTGTFTFNGTLQDHDRNPYPVGGPSTVTVAAPSGSTPSATRSFDKTTVEPDGEVVVVTITVADYGDTGGVAETLPAGFTYESSSLSAVRVTGQKVEFGLIGIPSFTYTVTAPRTTGTFTFNGTLQDHDRNPYPVGGPSTVTVAAPSGSTPSATRSFDKATVEPDGEVVVVTITVADYGDTGGVAETLPAGFTYESSSLSAVRVTGQKVEFGLIGIPSFTYTVTAPRTTGTFTFNGTLQDHDRNPYPVGGPSRVTVVAEVTPTPPRTPTPNRAPAFTRSTTTRSVAENSASGTNVGARVRATDADRDTLIYALSGADAGSFTIGRTDGQIEVDSQTTLDYETKDSYMVTVRGTDPDNASDTISVTIIVVNVDEMGTVTLSSTAPRVGAAITASVTDPDGVVTGETWQWARSADGSTGWADTGATSAAYTPVQADADNYLRATASYTDGEGSGKSAEAVSDNAVAGVPGDTNNDGRIDKPEVIAAYRAYVADPSDKTEMIAIFRQYVADSVSSE